MGPIFIKNSEALTLFFFFVFILLCLISGLVLYYKNRIKKIEKKHKQRLQKQRKLLYALKELSQEEQKNIAANLHDEISMALNIIRLNQIKITKNKNNESILNEMLTFNAIIIDETIEALKYILHDLMPPSLIKLGFIKGINELCYKINLSSEIKVTFNSPDIELSLTKTTELCLYRLIKEIITNIIKHGRASQIEINISKSDSFLFTKISHNGEGISMKKAMQLIHSGNGMGLKSIFSRAELSQSEIHYTSKINNTSVVLIKTKPS